MHFQVSGEKLPMLIIIPRSPCWLAPVCYQLALTRLPSLRMPQEPQRPHRYRNIISKEQEGRPNASSPAGEAKVTAASGNIRHRWSWTTCRPVASWAQPDAKKNTNELGGKGNGEVGCGRARGAPEARRSPVHPLSHSIQTFDQVLRPFDR